MSSTLIPRTTSKRQQNPGFPRDFARFRSLASIPGNGRQTPGNARLLTTAGNRGSLRLFEPTGRLVPMRLPVWLSGAPETAQEGTHRAFRRPPRVKGATDDSGRRHVANVRPAGTRQDALQRAIEEREGDGSGQGWWRIPASNTSSGPRAGKQDGGRRVIDPRNTRRQPPPTVPVATHDGRFNYADTTSLQAPASATAKPQMHSMENHAVL